MKIPFQIYKRSTKHTVLVQKVDDVYYLHFLSMCNHHNLLSSSTHFLQYALLNFLASLSVSERQCFSYEKPLVYV
jgi:hypothetical protein